MFCLNKAILQKSRVLEKAKVAELLKKIDFALVRGRLLYFITCCCICGYFSSFSPLFKLKNRTSSGLSCSSVNIFTNNLHTLRQCSVLYPQPEVALPCIVNTLNFTAMILRTRWHSTALWRSSMSHTCGG
jgi:hypothetical protein